MKKIDLDDKDLAIITIAIIVIACVLKFDAETAKYIVPAAITAIGSLATGRKRGEETGDGKK